MIPFAATVTVSGDPVSLQGYRSRVRDLLDEGEVEDYRELHTIDRLDWRFKIKDGIPFPAFVESSIEFPDLLVLVEWTQPAEGRIVKATIRNGNVTQKLAEAAQPDQADGTDQPCYDLRADVAGRISLAFVARTWRKDEMIGYALSADQHAWFHVMHDGDTVMLDASDGMQSDWAERWTVSDGHTQYRELGDGEAIDPGLLQELQRLSRDLCAEWIWFAAGAPEETVVERQRYGQYGLAVHEANVRSLKLRTVMKKGGDGGFEFSAERPQMIAVRDLLSRCWLAAGQGPLIAQGSGK